MGYTIRDERWRYTAWVGFDWGSQGDPKGTATKPKWDDVSARELYDHEGDEGDWESGERYEWENLASVKGHEATVAAMHAKLIEAVETGILKPMKHNEVL